MWVEALSVDFDPEGSMKPRTVATLFLAGLVAVAGPAWSQSRGGGSGRVSGGGHLGSGGHGSGVARHGAVGHPGGGPRGGVRHWGGGGRGWGGHFGWRGSHGWRGSYGWRGWYGWPGFYLGLPFWWGGTWGWGWPYDGWWNGSYDPYDPGSIYVPSDETGPSSGAGGAAVQAVGPTSVDTEVTPREALVYLNGVLVGSVADFDGTPDFLYLDAGDYTLEFRSAGYRSKMLDLNVGGENKLLVVLDLRRDPASGVGSPNPPSPGLPYGRKFGPSFGPATSQPMGRDRTAGGAQPPAASRQGMAALKVRVSPANAAVYIDGVLVGTGEELARLNRGIAVAPGGHRIDVVAPGHAPKTVQVEAEPGKEQELSLELE